MNSLRKLLAVVVGVELVAAIVFCGLRLNSTLPRRPPVELYADAITGRELLALPDQFLFDSVLKWRTLGEAYLVCGFFSKAEACFHQAAERDPRLPEVLVMRGYCLEQLGLLDEACEEFRRAANLGRRGKAETPWYRLGMVFLQLERPEEAREAFENAGEEHVPSLYQRAKLLVRSGYVLESGPLLERLAEDLPDDLRVWQLRAQAAESLGKIEEAAEARDAAERARETFRPVGQPPLDVVDTEFGLPRMISVARQLQHAGKKSIAAEQMLHFASDEIHQENRNVVFLQDAVPVQLAAGNVPAARRLLDQQIFRDGFPTARAWELHGFVEFMDNHLREAWQDWDRAERMRPESIDHNKLTEVAQRVGDQIAVKRHRALAKQYAGINAYRSNDLTQARSNLQAATFANPELSDAWFYLGQTERLLGNRSAAEAALRHCSKLDPDHGRARVLLMKMSAGN